MPSRAGKPNKNKQFLMNRLKDMLGEDFDPVIRMAEMATVMHARALDADADDMKAMKDSVDAWDKIAKYVTPALKAQEINVTSEGEDGTTGIKVTFVKPDGN